MTRIAVLVMLLAVVVLTACGGAPGGWERLWVEEWRWHNRGTNWVRGVAGGEFLLEVEGRGAALRGELLGFDPSGGSVVVTGSESTNTIRIGPLERRFVNLDLAAGEYSVRVPPGVAFGSPRLGLPRSGTRQLVFVLVDTLRADHVRADLTPGILDYFEDGRCWHQATANCSWTVPSVASLFTARPVLDISTPSGDIVGVPKGMATWPSLLARAGFEGAAVVANYTVHTLNGFSEGFSSYLVPDGHGPESYPDAAWAVEQSRRWLRAHRGEDAFLYLHLMDPHQPYRSHSEPGVKAPDLEPLAMRRREATDGEAVLLRRLYAEEVRHVDDVLTPFLAALPDDTVVVFTSDHGEALGEHGAWGHGLNLYQEGVLVPLLLRGPGVPRGEASDPAQLLDLGPTVLELMGVAAADEMVGRSLLGGGSQAPLVSTTFGGGPLRWAWRRGADKVVLRMSAQPGLGEVARSAMLEESPLPAGGFHFDLAADPDEEAPRPVPDRLLPPVGRAFAATAGSLVPGLQLVVWGRHGPVVGTIEVAGSVELVQAWSVSEMAARRSGDRLEISCDDAYPLCAVGVRVEPDPEWIAIRDGLEWQGGAPGERITLDRLVRPEADMVTGGHIWWNEDRTIVVEGHDETIERLRALGYIE